MRVLILRPEPGNAATAEAVATLGYEPVCAPLFRVEPVAWSPPDPTDFDAVAMTSANAARHGGPNLARYAHLPVFAVGEATADAARNAGFTRVETGAADAAALGAMLTGRVLHLAGADHRAIPTTADVTTVIVYRAAETDLTLPDCDIALIHSPRAGARLAALAADPDALTLVAISRAAADAAGSGWAAVHIADHPRDASMLATLARLCEAGSSQQGPRP